MVAKNMYLSAMENFTGDKSAFLANFVQFAVKHEFNKELDDVINR